MFVLYSSFWHRPTITVVYFILCEVPQATKKKTSEKRKISRKQISHVFLRTVTTPGVPRLQTEKVSRFVALLGRECLAACIMPRIQTVYHTVTGSVQSGRVTQSGFQPLQFNVAHIPQIVGNLMDSNGTLFVWGVVRLLSSQAVVFCGLHVHRGFLGAISLLARVGQLPAQEVSEHRTQKKHLPYILEMHSVLVVRLEAFYLIVRVSPRSFYVFAVVSARKTVICFSITPPVT